MQSFIYLWYLYGHMIKNKKEIDSAELFQLLESISKYVDEKVQMYALGGTALTILGIKPSTLDIDINIDSEKQYKYISKIFNKSFIQVL